MGTSSAATEHQVDKIIEDAIERKLPIVATYRFADGWRSYRSQFVSGSRSSRKIWIAELTARGGAESPAPQPGHLLGITFRVGHRKCMFSTVLEPSESKSGDASVTVRWPAEVHQLQRRVYERSAPPPGQVIAVRFWSVKDSAGPVASGTARIHYGELEDLSAGGMRVNAPFADDIVDEGTFHCLFAARPGEEPVIIEATLRHREAPVNGRASLGFQFIGLEATSDGQDLLNRVARIVRSYQNANLRAEKS